MPELTPKQAHFAEEYLKDLNGKQAAIRVGVADRNAEVQASKWLSNPKVAARVEQLRQNRSQKTNIDAAWVLERLAQEAMADVSDLYDDDGDILPVKKWPKIWRQGLVAGIDIEVTPDGVRIKKLKISDRVRRIELIGKHVGVNAFQDIVKHTGLDALAERMERAAKRGSE